VLFDPRASPKLGCETCRVPDDRTEFADGGAIAAIRSDKNIVVRLCHVLHMASHEIRYTLGSRQYFVLYEYWSARALIQKNISDNRSQPANCLTIDPDLHSYRAMLTSGDDFHTVQGTSVATPDTTALQRSDLNKFLFADIGTEASGMTLSVVSLFARQGNDPWREADRLAGLPKSEATASLARTIADMPRSLWCLGDALAIAVRLTVLLPVRPATGLGRAVGRPSARTAVVLACVALAVAIAIAAAVYPAAPTRFDGSDVASFATPGP
jgi:hypothetical protein